MLGVSELLSLKLICWEGVKVINGWTEEKQWENEAVRNDDLNEEEKNMMKEIKEEKRNQRGHWRRSKSRILTLKKDEE